MQYDFDYLPDRKGSDCVKWGYYDEDVLPMWVADMDFVSPEPVIRALRERVEHGVFGYPSSDLGVQEVICDRLSELYRWFVKPDDLVLLPGVATGFNLACHTVADPGGSALVQTPVYPPFLRAPSNAGLARQDAQLVQDHNGRYEIDWDSFEDALSTDTRLFILCNPHNPVGRVFRKEELAKMAEVCLRHGILVCSDEIHCDLLFSGERHIPLASLEPEIAQNTITLMAPSKTYNIPGLQFSFAVIQNRELRSRFRKAQQGLVSWTNSLGMAAAKAAYEGGQEWLDQLLAYLEANRDYIFDFVQTELPGVSVVKPEGTYLAWLDFKGSSIEGSPAEFFLKHARVALMDGKDFGLGGEGFVRLNFGCPRSMLVEALQRMKKALL
jgi:cysteine-S-conjugate beta-lyase